MKTKLFLDTEFDGFGGELLSMGIVSEDGEFFYEVLDTLVTDVWVEANVVPHLNKQPISSTEFQDRLYAFLSGFPNGICVIADWPDDVRYFCEAIITAPGKMMNIPSFEVRMVREISSKESTVPHNALQDAWAIKDDWERLVSA